MAQLNLSDNMHNWHATFLDGHCHCTPVNGHTSKASATRTFNISGARTVSTCHCQRQLNSNVRTNWLISSCNCNIHKLCSNIPMIENFILISMTIIMLKWMSNCLFACQWCMITA